MSKRQIRGCRAIVTGASSGIGRAVSRELARQGAFLVLFARREDRLQQLREEIQQGGGRAEVVAGDVTDPEARKRAVDTARACFGGLDVLVNNAGIGALGLFEDSDPQRLRTVMEVNFFALAEMTRLALPLLMQGRDPILVNVSSILGHRGVPHNSEYCASKFAVQGFSEALRAELTRHRIDLLVVSPGTTETEFFDRVIARTGEPQWPAHGSVSAQYVARKIVRAIHLGRHEVIPFGLGKVLCLLNRLAPGFVDRVMARYV